MNINNVELSFNIYTHDNFKLYQKSMSKLNDFLKEVEESTLSTMTKYKMNCVAISCFFDELFGKGTSKKVFNSNSTMEDYCNSIFQIENERKKQASKISGIIYDLEIFRNKLSRK